MADCAACGLPLQPAARFCRHCGAGVAEAGRLGRYAAPDRPDAVGQPATGQPATGQPATGQPAAGQPAAGQPATGQPATGQPAAGQPAAGQPATGQPATGQPATGQPATGQPATEQPATGGPAGGAGARAAGTGAGRRPPRPASGQNWPRRAGMLLLALLAVAGVAAASAAGTAALSGRWHHPAALVPGRAAPVGPPVPSPAGPAAPGDVPVLLDGSLRDSPHAADVVALFRRYYRSINSRDYDGWLTTLAGDRRPDSRPKFLDEYSTTTDDDVKVVGITVREDGTLLVAVSFRSRQDPKYAPPDQPVNCLRWNIVYPLVSESGSLRIALVEFVNRSYRPCAG
jgi:hypothetical protein